MSTPPRRELVARSVRMMLDARGLSPAALAQQSDMTPEELALRLAGVEAFDVDQLQAVSMVLEVNINDLLGS